MHPQKILHLQKTKADTWQYNFVTFDTHLPFESSTYSYKIRRPFLRHTKLGHYGNTFTKITQIIIVLNE